MPVWTYWTGTKAPVKNKGVFFKIEDDEGNHRGWFYVTKSGIWWYRKHKKTTPDDKLSWNEIVEGRGFRPSN